MTDAGPFKPFLVLLRSELFKVILVLQDLDRGFSATSVLLRRFLRLACVCKEFRFLIFTEGLDHLADKVPADAWVGCLVGDGSANFVDVLRQVCQEPDSCTADELKVKNLNWRTSLKPSFLETSGFAFYQNTASGMDSG